MEHAQRDDPVTRVAEGIARIRARFITMLEDRTDELYELLYHLDDVSLRETVYTEIQTRAHKLHGISANVGFPDIGSLAANLEQSVVRAMAENTDQNVQWVRKHMDELLIELERALNGT